MTYDFLSGAPFLEMAQTDLVGDKMQYTGHPVMVVVVITEEDTIQASTGSAARVRKKE